jgi:Family of unknown function (DUF6221)
VTDPVAFLRARLDEAERVAIAASSPRGGVPTEPSWAVQSEGWDAALPGGCGVVVAPDGDGVAVVNGSRRAEHIARWDPARVLAEVAAKRAMLDDLLAEPHHVDDEDEYRSCESVWRKVQLPGSGPVTCTCGRDERVLRRVTLMAQPYADHPDFDPAWRVVAIGG